MSSTTAPPGKRTLANRWECEFIQAAMSDDRFAITARNANAAVLERLASAGIYEGLHSDKPSWAV